MRILGISGSLRADSYNTKLLRAAGELLLDDVEFEIWDGLKAVPPYDEDDDRRGAPAAVTQMRNTIAGADALLFATPEYNSSVPGQLKNAIDWASRPFETNVLRNKPVAVVGASTGMFGAVWSQAELRKILASTGARVVEGEVAVGHAQTRFDEAGRLADDDLRARLAEVVYGLVGEAVVVSSPPERPSPRAVTFEHSAAA
jgi:chromate reductase, NAD(P)H dehydrogenase (quinone)